MLSHPSQATSRFLRCLPARATYHGLTTLCFWSAEHCSPSAFSGLFATRSTTGVKSAGPYLARSVSSSLACLLPSSSLRADKSLRPRTPCVRASLLHNSLWKIPQADWCHRPSFSRTIAHSFSFFTEATGDRFATPSYGVSSNASASFMTAESKSWRLASILRNSHKSSAKPRGTASHSCLMQVGRSSANTECCTQAPEKTAKTSRGLLNFLWTAVG